MRTTKPGDWVRICFDADDHSKAGIGHFRWKVLRVVPRGVVLKGYLFGPRRSWILANP